MQRRGVRLPCLAEDPGKVEVSIRVVGLHLEGAPVPDDGRGDVVEVFVQRAQVEGGLAARLIGLEGGAVAGARLLVPPHAVLEEAQVVPCRGIAGIDADHALVRVHGLFPALGIAVPGGGAREPRLRRVRRGNERPDHAHGQGLPGLALEVARGEVEEALTGAGVETQPVLLDDDALVVDEEPELGQGRLGAGGEALGAVEGGPHLPHGGALPEQRRGRARRHDVPEAIARRVGAEQPQALELGRALGGELEAIAHALHALRIIGAAAGLALSPTPAA